MACRGLRDLAKVGRRSLPCCAGRRWVRVRWEEMGTGDAQAHKPAGPQPSASLGTGKSSVHWDTHAHTLTHADYSHTPTHRLHTHTSGSSPWIAKAPGFFRLGRGRHVFQIDNRTWEAVPAQYLRQWTTGRHACKAKEQHRLESLLSVGGHSLLGIMGERWRSLT